MSPVRGKKAKSASKKKSARPPRPKARSAQPKKAAKAKGKTSVAKAVPKGKSSGAPKRRHCIAVDPFGDPCQSAPRLPSKYCTIHSYLDR